MAIWQGPTAELVALCGVLLKQKRKRNPTKPWELTISIIDPQFLEVQTPSETITTRGILKVSILPAYLPGSTEAQC